MQECEQKFLSEFADKSGSGCGKDGAMKQDILELIDKFISIHDENPKFLYLGTETFWRLRPELKDEVQFFPSIRPQIFGLTFFIVDESEHLNVG